MLGGGGQRRLGCHGGGGRRCLVAVASRLAGGRETNFILATSWNLVIEIKLGFWGEVGGSRRWLVRRLAGGAKLILFWRHWAVKYWK